MDSHKYGGAEEKTEESHTLFKATKKRRDTLIGHILYYKIIFENIIEETRKKYHTVWKKEQCRPICPKYYLMILILQQC